MYIGKRIIVVAALAALVTTCFGQGRGGFGFGPRVGFALMRSPAVKTDLKLTDDQQTKVQDLSDKVMTKMRDLFQTDGRDFEKIQADSKPIMEDANKELNTILTADQQTRLKQIAVQLAGNSAAASMPEVQTELKLTDDQKSKIAAIQKTAADANAAVRAKMQNQEIDFQAAGDAFRKNGEEVNTEIGKVLTDDQKATLKKMGGDTFTPDPPPGG
jgi:hypothetical protein